MIKKHLNAFGIVAVVILLLSVIVGIESHMVPASPALSKIHLMGPDGKTAELSVEIADTDAERETGLMFRDSLASATGMIFVFNQAQPLSFWMKNTRIPLDILFFDDQGKFVSRTTMIPCLSDPCQSYPSGAPSRYALEVNAEEHITHIIGDGWSLETAGLF